LERRVKTCLVVDDSRVIRKVSRRILEDLGFEVAEAGDGVEAMAWCTAVMPDVILLDWQMPVMDGLQFLKRLRAEPGGDAPKVVFCTVENDIERIREALEAGADEYIMKPFDGSIVAGKLEYLGLTA
jgi:two-component system chemotaxis response regulator CheY